LSTKIVTGTFAYLRRRFFTTNHSN